MPQPEKFWNWIAKRYAAQPIADEAAYERKLEITRGYLRPDMDVLEFGCGTGSTALAHASHVKHIRAIDFSAKMIEIAKGKAEAANVTNVTFERGDIEGLDAPDRSFDVVLGLSILHLLADKEAVIRKVHGLLRPGGVFVSSTACLGDTQGYLKLVTPLVYRLGFLPLVQVFTTEELVTSLRDAGFAIEHQWQPGKGKAVFIVAKRQS